MSLTDSMTAEPGPSPVAFTSNSSSTIPFLSSTFGHLKLSAGNATSYLNPSPMDLLLAVPRMLLRAGSFAFVTVPEHIDNMVARGFAGTVIASATGGEAQQAVAAAVSGAGLAQGTAAATVATAGAERAHAGGLSQAFAFQNIRNFGGVFSYLTSKWALGCFTVAIVLNRTQVYASSRRHINLSWPLRLALRIMPIIIFLYQTQSLLQAMRCQTSPGYPSLRYGKPDKRFPLDFSADGGILYHLSSTLLFWQSDRESCLAVNMIHPDNNSPQIQGSLPLLWPLFQSLCLSQFIETLSCAVQGRQVMTETGMSIFEHSLAFAEAETMVSNQLGFGPFGSSKPTLTKEGAIIANSTPIGASTLVTKAFILERMNTPPEVLLIGLISSLNNLSSHVLGVLGLQGKFRLINTGVWGLCFMSAFVWGFFTFSPEAGGDAGILRFPTVCIVGFIPHLLILVGICICACIYLLALTLAAISPPAGVPPPRSLKERLTLAHENLQANVQLSSIRVSMHEDFYTALLKIGFTALTIASEAVYLNEGRRVGVNRWTWLEEERMKEIEQSRASSQTDNTASVRRNGVDPGTSVTNGVTSTDEPSESTFGGNSLRGGYARERTTKILKGREKGGDPKFRADGVGALQRGARYLMAWDFFTGIFWLITGWLASGLDKLLEKAGINRRPQWLGRLVRRAKVVDKSQIRDRNQTPDMLEFWLLSDEGELSLPQDDNVDVEAETKKRLQIASDGWGEEDEKKLDSNLYGWWKHGGWWGERDESGDYQPTQKDDSTSIASMSTNTSDAGWETDDDQDGRRTPTQHDPYPKSRETTPLFDSTLDVSQLARLLDPSNAEERTEARVLAQHLASDHVVTRSQYRRARAFDKAHILTSTRYRPSNFRPRSANGKLTPDEEEQILEHLILTRRSPHPATHLASSSSFPTDAPSSSWKDGAEGLGSSGPQCVVCQCSPRTILAWPCRCLSICEDCRVTLAMTNFTTCVCCRQDVVGFSRLFVP
ncbi:MAG: hypothetical protein M1830_009140 [Pleopsidium flavum]|nr:MAG: hypothetical protein M1830_009140 [Pleopsidium flavum]